MPATEHLVSDTVRCFLLTDMRIIEAQPRSVVIDTGVVSGSLFAGDVAGATAIVIDDLISSGGTLVRAATACRERGATKVIAAAAHGLFTGGAPELFGPTGPDEVIVTNTVPLPSHLDRGATSKLTVIDASKLVAEVIARTHRGEAVSDLLPYD